MQNMGFIAEELQSFSRGVEQLMEDVDGTTSDLLRDLQGLEECIDGLGRQREEDSTRLGHALAKVDDSAVAIERLIGGGDVTGTDPLGAILRSSQQALSSFQYHDPMAQDLQTIDALVAELRTAMSDDGDDSEILPLLYRKRIGDEVAPDGASSDGANGGDVFLF
jgi:hypothetical protein